MAHPAGLRQVPGNGRAGTSTTGRPARTTAPLAATRAVPAADGRDRSPVLWWLGGILLTVSLAVLVISWIVRRRARRARRAGRATEAWLRPSQHAAGGKVKVNPVCTAAELADWIAFPRVAIYPASSPWVPQPDRDLQRMLDRRQNPFFQYGDAMPYLATDGQGHIVGRILAHVDRRTFVLHGERAACFGFFECHENAEAAQALLAAAAAFGAHHQCTVVRGPLNMTIMQGMGIVVDGFEAVPGVDQTYTATYYPALLAGAGLRPVFPVTTYQLDDLAHVAPDMLLGDKQRALLTQDRVRIRPVDLHAFDREIELLRELINDAFDDFPYFVPMTHEEYRFLVGPYRNLIDPGLVLIAELEGVPCGFVIAVPNFNPLLKRMQGHTGPLAQLTFALGRTGIREAVGTLMGVRRPLRGQGLMHLLQAELLRALQRRQYDRLIMTWVADANHLSHGIYTALGGQPLHRLALFEGSIAELGEMGKMSAPMAAHPVRTRPVHAGPFAP